MKPKSVPEKWMPNVQPTGLGGVVELPTLPAPGIAASYACFPCFFTVQFCYGINLLTTQSMDINGQPDRLD